MCFGRTDVYRWEVHSNEAVPSEMLVFVLDYVLGTDISRLHLFLLQHQSVATLMIWRWNNAKNVNKSDEFFSW